ncbi:TetR/AcrR family transcriptional regulator [Aeromonas dhakensis]|uniref:TetR/AcrR family transcriptional regulator n=1 Tax=Aeromonas dhakensis TaxID=196024 RepID=UPI0035714ECD
MNETRPYHHGNLRQALIDAALLVVERDGYQALSLRDLAQALGVSRGAPYRHFPDRDALLRACAKEGFRLLLEAHREVMKGPASPKEKAYAVCREFLAFSETKPGLFMLMYDSGLLEQAKQEDELGQIVQAIYEGIASTLAEALGDRDETSLKARLISMWSTIYGFARLRQGHMLKSYMIGSLTREETEAAIVTAAIGPLPVE